MVYLLKACVVTAIFYIIYKVFLQRNTFFKSNRGFLLLGLITSFIFPFLVIHTYIEYTPASTIITDYNFEDISTVVETKEEPFNILDYLPIVYFLGVSFFSIRFITQFTSLITLIFKNKNEKHGDFIYVKIHTNISPFSFFNWIVYNPDQFNKTELDQIIMHEKVHAQQYHSIDILLTQLSCILLWFNPFIWLYNKDLKQNLEFLADSSVINHIKYKKEYQYTLLKTSLPTHQLALSNNFYNSLIKKRIIMLHKSKSKKINLIKYAFVIPLLTIFLMSFNTENVYVETPDLNAENETAITEVSSAKNDIETFIIYNNFTDAKFNAFKAELKSKGYDFNLKNIQRRVNNFITAINFTISKNGIDGNYTVSSGEFGINTIVIEYSKIKNKFSINTLNFLENEKRNANNPDVVEIIIDKNTTHASIENKKKLLEEKHNIVFDFEIIDKNSKNEIVTYSFKIGHKDKKSSSQKITINASNPTVIKYNPITNSVSYNVIDIKGDNYGFVQNFEKLNYYVIHKDNSDENLRSAAKYLKKKGITVKFTNVKRNDKGEIISIKINAKSEYGNVNYNHDSGEPIPSIAISYHNGGKGLKIGAPPIPNDHNFKKKKNKNENKNEDKDKDEDENSKKNLLVRNHTTDEVLKLYAEKLKKKGVTIEFNDVKRNVKGKIISININARSEYGNVNYNQNHGEPITPIVISNDKENGLKIGLYKPYNQYAMNEASLSSSYSFNTNSNPEPKVIEKLIKESKGKAIYILDGKEITEKELRSINEDKISHISILKGKSAAKKYGEKSKNGVVEITTKVEEYKKNQISEINNSTLPLYIIDGKEMTKEDLGDFEDIDHNNIYSLNVIKGKTATKKYGDKGKNGVVEIAYKKEKTQIKGINGNTPPLYILDGKEITNEGFETIDRGNIHSINVIKDKEDATKKYSEKGKNGVIEITTKKE
ncbi:M56 family metallopeptidase [Flavivirga jejuensis]|uniref:M56 family metallopeptidase n=1 Tax=Flavivirga jejuensis TaxID=870487 RepID=A0ABT8WLM4_9FLAO|nr:M56 family metallopeptidase [Flavivirga jejuensis]MDO5974040.1 M56 family metallopeptidase [Flavivirga jejuensis]